MKKLNCVLFMLLLPLSAYADSPPTVSISLDPVYAAPGDTITVNANASDDVGVRGIYFYYPDSASFTFQNCSDTPTCSKAVSTQVGATGNASFCVRAIDTANQMSERVCSEAFISFDRPPVIKYFQAEQKENGVPTAHVGGTGKYGIVAEDDNGIEVVYVEDVTSGKTDEHACGNLKTCVYEFTRFFTTEGVYTFCVYARDTAGQMSAKKCIQVNVLKNIHANLLL